MRNVAITGWTKGCNTIDAIKLIREKASLPLNEALDAVNRVLRNEEVLLPLPSQIAAVSLADALERIGFVANCFAVSDS